MNARKKAVSRSRHQTNATPEIAAVHGEQTLCDKQGSAANRHLPVQSVRCVSSEQHDEEGEQKQPGNDKIECSRRRDDEKRAPKDSTAERNCRQRTCSYPADWLKLVAKFDSACCSSGQKRHVRACIGDVRRKAERDQRRKRCKG